MSTKSHAQVLLDLAELLNLRAYARTYVPRLQNRILGGSGAGIPGFGLNSCPSTFMLQP